MTTIRSIIANNNATFYNYRTAGRVRIWPRVVLLLMVSPVLSFCLSANLTNFINSINTVASILLGFGFSVLFYIASTREDQVSKDESLEKMNRVERINKLSKELFHNVSYFVVAASAALAFGMIVIIPEANNDWFAKKVLPYLAYVTSFPDEYLWWLGFVIRSVFFFLILEAAYTFARIVGRVNFLFEEKLSDGNGAQPR